MATLTERVAHNSERIGVLEECTSEIATVLMGTPRSGLAGGGRNQDGIVHKVERIEAMLTNGGVHSKLTGGQRAALWASAFGALGAVVAASITAIVGA